ncbi:hypothetical protein H4582DRAFT_1883 [Lactarius indigo]|nr:hypothetical protein H4582DRAFT_1883 [Lactarius indigo]
MGQPSIETRIHPHPGHRASNQITSAGSDQSSTYRLMSPAQFPDNSPDIINGVYEVASHHVGKGLLDIIRDRFTDGKIRSGHYYFNRTRSLIRQHYPGLPLKDQNTIHFEFVKVLGVQEELEGAQGNVFKNYARARKYKRISKDTFKIVERASNRSVNNNLFDQFSEALGGRRTLAHSLIFKGANAIY